MKKNGKQSPLPPVPKEADVLLAQINGLSLSLQADAAKQLESIGEAVDELWGVLYRVGLIDETKQWRKSA